MKCKNVFITGCNRPNGIGFGLVKQILERYTPKHLFATCRNAAEAKELNELASKYGNLHVVEIDVTNTEKYEDITSHVDKVTDGDGINLLINNAAILGGKQLEDKHGQEIQGSISELKREDFLKHLEINTVAPILLTKAFLPLLEKAAKKSNAPCGIEKAVIVNISSDCASITETAACGPGLYLYMYRTSKAGLNMATKCMSLELKDKGIVTIMLHPGWVQTDMGGPNGFLTTDQSVSEMLTLLDKLGANDNGKFLQFDGKELPW